MDCNLQCVKKEAYYAQVCNDKEAEGRCNKGMCGFVQQLHVSGLFPAALLLLRSTPCRPPDVPALAAAAPRALAGGAVVASFFAEIERNLRWTFN